MANLFQYDSHLGNLEIFCDLVDEVVPTFITQVKELATTIQTSNAQKLPLLLITEKVVNMNTVGFATILAILQVLSDKFDVKILATSRIKKFAKLYYLEDFLANYYIQN